MPDIDIDTPSNFNLSEVFTHSTTASMIKDGVLVKHPVGCYFQNIPNVQHSNLSAIPYQQAEELGYFKIDFLHLTFLNHFSSKQELRSLLAKEPNWDLLKSPSLVKKLQHLRKHVQLVQQILPRSVEEIADILALIRPAKQFLINDYVKLSRSERVDIRKRLFERPQNNTPYFKKAHAIAYAHNIVLQLHLFEYGVL